MKQFTASLSLAFAMLAGCGGAQQAGAKAPTCAAAAANAEKVILALGEQQGEDMRTMATAGRDTYAERCGADGWASTVIACAAAAPDAEAIQTCVEGLTPGQHQAMQDTFAAKLK